MKKIYATLIAIFAITHFSYAQWSGGPTGLVYYNGGSVGIGTNAPTGLLHLKALSGTDIIQITKSSSSADLEIYSAYDGSDSPQQAHLLMA